MKSRRSVRLLMMLSLAVCLCLSWANVVFADVVTDWNLIATQLAVPARPGPSSILDIAMVHIAMHDAIQSYHGRYELYGPGIPNASGSPIAAAATAAHDVLVARFPASATTLDATLDAYLGGLGLLGDTGASVGHQAAANILNLRANDGSFPANPEIFTGGTEPGEWRPTPPSFAPMSAPWLGKVSPFALEESSQFRAGPPLDLTSRRYARDYNETKAMGSVNSTMRTQAQTDLALFYSDNFIGLWERTLRGIADTNLHRIGESARLFALANIAAADAIITAWDSKRLYHFWRPVTAIPLGDTDGNPQTVGDPAWLPLIPTPTYPEYTSGANNLTGSITRTLRNFFGRDRFTFSVTSAAVNQTRTYQRFTDMADDVVNVRVYQGIHFRTADELGRRQGQHSADWAFAHVLRRIDD
jgi:hypothetical protein